MAPKWVVTKTDVSVISKLVKTPLRVLVLKHGTQKLVWLNGHVLKTRQFTHYESALADADNKQLLLGIYEMTPKLPANETADRMMDQNDCLGVVVKMRLTGKNVTLKRVRKLVGLAIDE